jgi:uncharacterized membrane protein
MPQLTDDYNIFAGHDLQRIKALADGVFSIAMTILVLELSIPFLGSVHSEGDLWIVLLQVAPRLLVYFMSFITLGIFWTGHSLQYTFITESDRHLNWISIFFLMFVALIPFSTAFLTEYITFKLAIGVYWLNILILGIFTYVHWQYACKSGSISHEIPDFENTDKSLRNRIITAQIFYAIAALLCFISTYLSIAVLIAIQLNYAFAPRFRHRSK